jgi:hypothetical protein
MDHAPPSAASTASGSTPTATPRGRDATLASLRAWLLARRPTLDPAALTDETDIIEARVLESLELVEFMLYIESLSGREVLSEGLDPDRLRTLARIYASFFAR